MPGYIDLHNHILHNIDDGPATLNEAVDLALSLVEAGYKTVVATPHVVEGEPSLKLILARLKELNLELRRQKIDLNVLPGGELHIEPLILKRLQGNLIPTLAGSRYLLLELPFTQPLPLYTEELVGSLTAAGYRTIIAHPERAAALQQDPRLLYRLHALGALYQLTWGALTGRLGPEPEKLSRLMIKANLAHFFATDAHRAATRLAQVSVAAEALEDMLGPGHAETFLITRPRKVIEDENFLLPAPQEVSLKPASQDLNPKEALKRLFNFKRPR